MNRDFPCSDSPPIALGTIQLPKKPVYALLREVFRASHYHHVEGSATQEHLR